VVVVIGYGHVVKEKGKLAAAVRQFLRGNGRLAYSVEELREEFGEEVDEKLVWDMWALGMVEAYERDGVAYWGWGSRKKERWNDGL